MLIFYKAADDTPVTFFNDHIKECNKGNRQFASTPQRELVYNVHKLVNLDSVHLQVYSDASDATSNNLSSHLENVILLAEDSNACHILDYSSRKPLRIALSIISGETCAFWGALETAFDISTILKISIRRDASIMMPTDSKHLFDAFVEGKITTERHLMIETGSSKQCF